MKRFFRALLVLAAITAGWYAPLSNAALLFENYAPVVVGGVGGTTYGTEFTVGAQSLNVTKLGTFAGLSGGASTDMRVAIWRASDQTLIGSASVPSIGAIAMQGWNFVNVAPFTLLANTVYRIGAETENGTIAWGGSYEVGSGVASVTPGYVWSGSPGFMYPSLAFPQRFFAANAEIAPVPEPSAFLLLAFGLVAVWIVRRRV
jgi:hypothetical protein